jgi:hypothetical protein
MCSVDQEAWAAAATAAHRCICDTNEFSHHSVAAGVPLVTCATCLAAMSGVMGAGAESNTIPPMQPMQLVAEVKDAASEPSARARLGPLSLCSCCDAAKSAPCPLPEALAACAWLWPPCSAASRSSVPRKMKPALLQQAGYDSGHCGVMMQAGV